MIPLKDENPTNNKSYIRLIILIICSLIFLFQSFGGINNFLIGYFGFKPISLIDSSGIKTFSPFLTIFTSRQLKLPNSIKTHCLSQIFLKFISNRNLKLHQICFWQYCRKFFPKVINKTPKKLYSSMFLANNDCQIVKLKI